MEYLLLWGARGGSVLDSGLRYEDAGSVMLVAQACEQAFELQEFDSLVPQNASLYP